ncbi:MAG: hypothetical protein IPO93_05600 [Actinobacteria bacterium]|nr:hypothetical protein [Actinomycetota bacterium]
MGTARLPATQQPPHSRIGSFHPQRLFPTFARPVEMASRVPGGLRLSSRLLGPIAFDRGPSTSEDPALADVEMADVAVVGFPRSGTTFMQSAISVLLDSPTACWKNHDPFTIRTFVDAGTPVLVPVREPLDAVVSLCLYHQDEPSAARMRQRIAMYTAWHREVSRQLDSPLATVVDFVHFSLDPADALTRVLGHKVPALDPALMSVEQLARDIRSANRRAGLDVGQRNTPSTRREEMKAPFLRLADDPRIRAPLARARAIYAQLTATVEIRTTTGPQ